MSVRLWLLERRLPAWGRRQMLAALARVTADAFGAAAPPLARLAPDLAVRAFASFTTSEVERVVHAGGDAEAEAVRRRLHDGARDLGRATARWLGVATHEDALRALRLLYRGIGIDLDASPVTGDVVVSRCLFSTFYTPAACAFVSALDAGFVAGLTGGASLAFSERITEGAPCCRARLSGGALR